MNQSYAHSVVLKTGLLSFLTAPIVLFYLALGKDPSHIPSAQIGKKALAFSLPRVDGKGEVRLLDYKNKWVVINFWASWCAACKQEHKLLVEAGKRFANHPRISMIGVNFRDSKKNALSFLKRYGIFPYPSGKDPRGRVGIDFGVYGLPETFFLSPDGKIVARHVGVLKNEILQRHLKTALQKE